MTKPPFLPTPIWNYYVLVDSVNGAVDRIKSAGGMVTNGPHQVPDGSFILQGVDPQGAAFCLISTAP
jgi:predicted enzyme related to lactoylglutathione lyase